MTLALIKYQEICFHRKYIVQGKAKGKVICFGWTALKMNAKTVIKFGFCLYSLPPAKELEIPKRNLCVNGIFMSFSWLSLHTWYHSAITLNWGSLNTNIYMRSFKFHGRVKWTYNYSVFEWPNCQMQDGATWGVKYCAIMFFWLGCWINAYAESTHSEF